MGWKYVLAIFAPLVCFSSAVEPEGVKYHFDYPVVRRNESVVDDYFGTIVEDPYRWLEDPDSEETKTFVEEQNNLTLPYIKLANGREKIHKRIESLYNYPKYGTPVARGNRYFYFLKNGLQNQGVLYVQDGFDGEPRILLDPNTLAADGTIAVTAASPSPDGEIYSYGLSSKGSDWVTVHFKNVSTGENFPEILQHTKWPGMEWTPDNLGVFYSGYPKPNGTADGSETTANENMKLYYHKVGTSQDDDTLIAEFLEFPKRTLSAELSDDDKYLIVSTQEGLLTNLIYYIELQPLRNAEYRITNPELIPLLVKDDAKYSFVGNDDNVFYFITNKDAPNYKVVAVYLENPEEKYWATLLPQNPRDVLDWVAPINQDKFVACYIHDVKSVLEIHRMKDGSLLREIPLDSIGTVGSYSGKRYQNQFFYSLSSFVSPGKIFKIDFENGTGEPELFKESKVEGVVSQDYTITQVFYKSKDGTKIPMFIIHLKTLTLDGTAPTLLYGYGGFDISLQPSFSERVIGFIQIFNGVVAIPNIRGGGEYGAVWHDSGRVLNKQNTFDDFQAAAEYLMENKYTSKEKLTIQGGSNGGLLVGACITQRPELFGAALVQVGVLDMLRYHKFTIGYAWATDYGRSDNKTEFEYLIKYSPLHNVRLPKDETVQYPAVLVMTSDHDDRVVPLHSYKFISELQYKIGTSKRQTNPLLILIETSAGHGAGKPTSKKINEYTDMFSFLVQALGLQVV